jgi:glycosyltransferase involved in cell wall biosynthesis
MAEYKVAIVIPAFNEENTITQVVNSVKLYGCPIVVNDASNDKTKELAYQAGAIVVNHIINQGYDKALNSGFAEADKRGFDAIITFDADGQHNPMILEEYINHLKNGKDLILGIRPKLTHIAERLFAVCAKFKFGWQDPLCGMKGYSMDLYRKQGYFDSYESIGTELSIFGLVNQYPYTQLRVDIFIRKDQSRFYSVLISNLRVIKSLIKLCSL